MDDLLKILRGSGGLAMLEDLLGRSPQAAAQIEQLRRQDADEAVQRRLDERMAARDFAEQAPERTQAILSLGEQAPKGYGPVQPGMERGMDEETRATMSLQDYLKRFGFMRGGQR